MKLVPAKTWLSDAYAKFAEVRDCAHHGNFEDAHAAEDTLHRILIEATLDRADPDTLHEIAQVCASTVFLDFTRRYE